MDKKTEYNLAYSKATYKRVPLDVRKEDVEAFRLAASMDGTTLNAWIKDLMAARCDALGIVVPSRTEREA